MRTRLVAVAAVAAFALAGCGGGEPVPPAATGGTTSAAPQPSATTSGAVPDALTFTGKTLDGDAFDASMLAGKPVVLWFWAPWCPKCRAAAPDVQAVVDAHGDVRVLGVGGLGKTGEMRTFAADTRISFPSLADESGTVWKKFGITQQHTFVLIGSDGKIVHKGALSGDELERKVGDLA